MGILNWLGRKAKKMVVVSSLVAALAWGAPAPAKKSMAQTEVRVKNQISLLSKSAAASVAAERIAAMKKYLKIIKKHYQFKSPDDFKRIINKLANESMNNSFFKTICDKSFQCKQIRINFNTKKLKLVHRQFL